MWISRRNGVRVSDAIQLSWGQATSRRRLGGPLDCGDLPARRCCRSAEICKINWHEDPNASWTGALKWEVTAWQVGSPPYSYNAQKEWKARVPRLTGKACRALACHKQVPCEPQARQRGRIETWRSRWSNFWTLLTADTGQGWLEGQGLCMFPTGGLPCLPPKAEPSLLRWLRTRLLGLLLEIAICTLADSVHMLTWILNVVPC